MLAQVDLDGTSRTLKEITQVDLDGTTVRNLKQLWQNDNTGTPRLIFSGLGVTITPAYAFNAIAGRGSVSITVGPVYSNVLGGTPPLTYAWTVSGDFSVVSATAPSTTFLSISLGEGEFASGSAYVTVTDANGTTAVSSTVILSARNYGYSFGGPIP